MSRRQLLLLTMVCLLLPQPPSVDAEDSGEERIPKDHLRHYVLGLYDVKDLQKTYCTVILITPQYALGPHQVVSKKTMVSFRIIGKAMNDEQFLTSIVSCKEVGGSGSPMFMLLELKTKVPERSPLPRIATSTQLLVGRRCYGYAAVHEYTVVRRRVEIDYKFTCKPTIFRPKHKLDKRAIVCATMSGCLEPKGSALICEGFLVGIRYVRDTERCPENVLQFQSLIFHDYHMFGILRSFNVTGFLDEKFRPMRGRKSTASTLLRSPFFNLFVTLLLLQYLCNQGYNTLI